MLLLSKRILLASCAVTALTTFAIKAKANIADEYKSEKCNQIYKHTERYNDSICTSRSGIVYDAYVESDGSFYQRDKIGAVGKQTRHRKHLTKDTIIRKFEYTNNRGQIVYYQCRGYSTGWDCSSSVGKDIYEYIGTPETLVAKRAAERAAREAEIQRRKAEYKDPTSGTPWWLKKNVSLIGKRKEFRSDVALKRYRNLSSSEDYSCHSRSGDWRAYGDDKVNWSEWKRDGNYLMAPLTLKSGHSVTIAVDCSKKSFNLTHPKDNKWIGWKSISILNVALKTMIKDVCSAYG